MGGGGVNEPTPNKKKYKSDPAIVVQPRFVEPFYRNYDLYDVEGVDGPAKHGPGSGYNHMNEFKSIKDFLEFRRNRLKGKYVAEDSWIEDTAANRKERAEKMKIRSFIFNRLVKQASGHHFKTLCSNCGVTTAQCRCPGFFHESEPQTIEYVDSCSLCKTTGDENDGPNFDYGDGAYTAMSEGKKMNSITDAPHKSPGAFFADAQYMLPPKEHGTSIYNWRNSIYQGTPGKHKKDSNDIDFPIDEEIHTGPIIGDSGNYEKPIKLGPAGDPELDGIMPGTENEGEFEAYPYSAQLGGYLDKYLPDPDQDGKSPASLDFGHDLTNDDAPVGRNAPDIDLDMLEEKYLNPAETEIYGLPDGVDPEAKDADQTIETLNPEFGIPDSGLQMYQDKWNI